MATVNFTSAQFAGGFAGPVSTTKNAARIYGIAIKTVWAGFITGTDAVLTATRDGGALDAMVEVSINGGSFSSAARSGTAYTLFTGLSDVERFVVLRYGAAFGNTPYIASSGNVLAVTGAAPALAPFQNWAQIRDGNSLTASSAMTVGNTAQYDPTYIVERSSSTNGSNVASLKIKGAFNRMAIAGTTTDVYVSKNGGAPTKYSMPVAGGSVCALLISGLGGDLATYHIWNAANTSTSTNQFAASGDAALQDCGGKRKLDQYGDSITQGAIAGTGATRGDVETMRVAAAMGFVGSTSGVSGHTTPQCATLMDTVLPNRAITSNDVAVLAIGRNDSPMVQADYQSCINKLLTAGYGKVLCRGVLPEGANTFPTTNGTIQAAIAAVGNSNVIFINTATWSGIQTSDTTHPTPTGYVTIAGYALPAYLAALGLSLDIFANDMAVAVAMDAVALALGYTLTVQDMSVACAVDAIALTQANTLALSDMTVAASMDAVALTQQNTLQVQALDVAVLMDAPVLVVGHVLVVQEMAVVVGMDGMVLAQAVQLVIADLAIAASMESPLLSPGFSLVVQALDVAVAIDSVQLVPLGFLQVQDLSVLVSSDNVVLSQNNSLVVQDLRTVVRMDLVTFGGGIFSSNSAMGFNVAGFEHAMVVEA